jgi:hypothetical protein
MPKEALATPLRTTTIKKKQRIRGQFAYIENKEGEARCKLIFSAMLMEWQYPPKKNPGFKTGVNQGGKT